MTALLISQSANLFLKHMLHGIREQISKDKVDIDLLVMVE